MPRLQIDVTEEQVNDLEKLKNECRVATKKELFNNAFTLLEWAVGESKKGNIIASIDESAEKYRELQMPILNNVRPVAKQEGNHRAAE